MHIYDSHSDKTLEEVILYLTSEEAYELYDGLARIMKQPRGNHVHVNNDDYQRELTVCIYRKEDIETFDEKSRQMLEGS